MHLKMWKVQNCKLYVSGKGFFLILLTVLIIITGTKIGMAASKSGNSYYVTMSLNHFGIQILSASEDNFKDPSHADFSLQNGTQLWYSTNITSDVPVTPADPGSHSITATFFSYHLLPPTGVIPLDWNGSYQFETMKLSAGFSGPNQQTFIDLNPFTIPAVTMDSLGLIYQILGDKEGNEAVGLAIPDAIQQILDTVQHMEDLTNFVNDFAKLLHDYPQTGKMQDDVTACAKDLASLFENKDEVDKLANIIELMQGEDVPTSDILDEVESFSTYWVRTVQLGFLILGFLRDEIMAMGSVLFEQADPTITIQSKSFATPTPTPLPAGTTTFYPLGGNYGYVYQIIPGTNGDFWFATNLTDQSTHSVHNFVGHMTANGTTSVFSTFNSLLAADTATGQGEIALGPDGAIWAAEPGSPASNFQGGIERVTASGQITSYPLPSTLNTPYSIVAGPDGALWFTSGQSGPMNSSGMIGRITTGGSVSEYPLPQGEFPVGITVGPDGALWISYNGVNDTFSGVARMNTNGQITASYTIPSGEGGVSKITSGLDGALWIEAYPFIDRVTISGTTSQIQGASGIGADFAFAPNGNLWDIGVGGGAGGAPNCRLTQLSTSGQRLQSFPLFPCASGVFTFDSNGNIWTEMLQNGVEGIGRIVP